MVKELRDLLKSQNLDTVLPSALKQVGGAVFPDRMAEKDLADFVQVVDSFRGVHSPTYGTTIPMSGATVSTVGKGIIYRPEKTQVASINAISITNSESADASINIQIVDPSGATVNIGTFTATASTETAFPLSRMLFLDYQSALGITINGFTDPSTITTNVSYNLISQ